MRPDGAEPRIEALAHSLFTRLDPGLAMTETIMSDGTRLVRGLGDGLHSIRGRDWAVFLTQPVRIIGDRDAALHWIKASPAALAAE